MGKRKTKTCSGSRPAAGSRRRIAHREAWQACEARSPFLAAKHSEVSLIEPGQQRASNFWMLGVKRALLGTVHRFDAAFSLHAAQP